MYILQLISVEFQFANALVRTTKNTDTVCKSESKYIVKVDVDERLIVCLTMESL